MSIARSALYASLLTLMVAACGDQPTVASTVRTFALVGTQGVARWNSSDVPGSMTSRPGTTLPAFLVCEAPATDTPTWAAAVVDRGALSLHGDGTARLEFSAGTWWKSGTASGGSGGPVSEYGRWTEPTAGTIYLSGFTTIAFAAPLQYTELGSALTSATFECPGISSVARLTSELIFQQTP